MITKLKLIGRLGFALAIMAMLVAGCGGDDPVTTQQSEYDVIQPAVNGYVGNANKAPVITAQALFDNMNDGDASNDYTVLSVRSAEHYQVGHIPGAVNIPWREIGTDAVSALPTDKPIAVYCYTGHTGGIATSLLNVMGYDAYNLKFGIGSWTKDASVRVAAAFDETSDSHDFATETQVNAPTQTFEIPTTDFSNSDDADAVLVAAADHVASNISGTILAQALFDILNDGDTSNDPVVVSVRGADHYALGHVPGAINIPWRSIGLEANLQKLDPDKQIVVYCYTGHTGAVAAAALNLLGYNAVNMKFGMTSWTRDATIRATSAFNEDTDAHDFQITTGPNP